MIRPSRASNPTRSCQPSQDSWLPSRVKLGPSGWVISIGRRSGRVGPTKSGSWKFASSSGTGRTTSSTTSITSRVMTSTYAVTPSTGCAHGRSFFDFWMNVNTRCSRRPRSSALPGAPADSGWARSTDRSVSPRLAIAASQRGSACTISSTISNSNPMTGTPPSTAGSSSRADTTRASEVDTTTSCERPVAVSINIARSCRLTRSPGEYAATADFSGSSRPR